MADTPAPGAPPKQIDEETGLICCDFHIQHEHNMSYWNIDRQKICPYCKEAIE